MNLKLASLLILCASCFAQELPDAPSTVQPPVIQPGPKFFQFRKGPQAPPLATTKQVFKSKVFMSAHLIYTASVITDIQMTHEAKEKWHSEAPVIPVIWGMDYLMYRFICPCESVEAAGYGTYHYLKDLVEYKQNH